ncbi:ferritin-like domain-containing protein [Arthrobacter sp. YAF17]|uniref:ferritin-like domain-containing protein n=1 Tax=Arthrobacter sp. YAF17 TaxID=3233077 RepID=UPI003F8DD86C
MTTWSVVKDDTRQKRRRGLIPRIALLACLALVVVSLGMAFSPGIPKEPAEPPFSEQARSAALTETMRLRAAGEELGRSIASGGQPAVARTVSLLTSQARALLLPGQDSPESPPAEGAPSSATPSASPSSPPLPATAAALATELAASASQRLADAAMADGGMARLLAAVGTAQLLQASSLAAAAGAPAPAVPDPAAPSLFGACPSAPASPSSAPASSGAAASAGRDTGTATLPGALAAIVRTELETVYGYQVALTRLSGDAAASASQQLARHEALASGAEALSRMHCAAAPAREAGYTMAPAFLASPATGLGGLETSALTAYGDLVALSEGQTRQWAISGLVGAARRSALWGADTGAVPGLAADPETFPPLPAPSVMPGP